MWKKTLYYGERGRIKSRLDTAAAGGDDQTAHRDELPIDHAQVFASRLLSSSFSLFAGKAGRCKPSAGADVFAAPAPERCSGQCFQVAVGSSGTPSSPQTVTNPGSPPRGESMTQICSEG